MTSVSSLPRRVEGDVRLVVTATDRDGRLLEQTAEQGDSIKVLKFRRTTDEQLRANHPDCYLFHNYS